MPKQKPLPPELPQLVESLSHPDVSKFEIMTTEAGEWGVRAYIRNPIPRLAEELKEKLGDFPLLIESKSPPMQVARPGIGPHR